MHACFPSGFQLEALKTESEKIHERLENLRKTRLSFSQMLKRLI